MRPLAAVAAGVLLLTTLGVASASCSNYQSCAECVCNTRYWDVYDSCTNSDKCQWCGATDRCTDAGQACADTPIPSMWPGGTTYSSRSQREANAGQALCPAQSSVVPGGIAIVCIFMGIGGLLLVATVLLACCRAADTAEWDTQWLLDIVRGHVSPGETVAWSGCSGKPTPRTAKSLIFTQALLSLPLMVPSIVWIGIGLPLGMSRNNFGFFFPIGFVVGLGVLMNLVYWLTAKPLSTSQTVYAYIITNKSILTMTGNQGTRIQTGLTSKSATTIPSLTITGRNLNAGYGVSLQNLRDTSAPYKVLLPRVSSTAVRGMQMTRTQARTGTLNDALANAAAVGATVGSYPAAGTLAAGATTMAPVPFAGAATAPTAPPTAMATMAPLPVPPAAPGSSAEPPSMSNNKPVVAYRTML